MTLDLDPSSTPLQELIPVGQWLGIKSRTATYDAARRGEIPTIRLGARLMVPTAQLLAMVGMSADASPEAGPSLQVVEAS